MKITDDRDNVVNTPEGKAQIHLLFAKYFEHPLAKHKVQTIEVINDKVRTVC